MNWLDFKKYVLWLRSVQEDLIRQQNGSNKVMVEISVIDENDHNKIGLGSISFTPHSIDLRTGKVFAWHNSLEEWKTWNVKELLSQ